MNNSMISRMILDLGVLCTRDETWQLIRHIYTYLFLEPRQERGGHGRQAGESLAKLDGGLHQITEEGHRDAVHVRHGGAVQLDAPVG